MKKIIVFTIALVLLSTLVSSYGIGKYGQCTYGRDALDPFITFNESTPADAATVTVPYVFFNLTLYDALCTLNNNTFEFDGINYTVFSNTSINLTGVVDGTYSYRAFAENAAGLINNTETRTLTFSSGTVAQVTSEGGGSSGNVYVIASEGCMLNITPSSIEFNQSIISVKMNISNMGNYSNNVKISAPLVPTLFGAKDFVKVSLSSFSLARGRFKTIDVELSDTVGIVEDTYLLLGIEAINCNINVSINIPEDIAIFYDLNIKTNNFFYELGEIVNSTITIVNKGDEPDTDTNLILLLIDPEGNSTVLLEEKLFEVPVGVTVLSKEFAVLEGMDSGTYSVGVEYFTKQQGLLTASSSFYVLPVKKAFFYVGIAVIAFIIAYLLLLLWLVLSRQRKDRDD